MRVCVRWYRPHVPPDLLESLFMLNEAPALLADGPASIDPSAEMMDSVGDRIRQEIKKKKSMGSAVRRRCWLGGGWSCVG